MHQKIVQRPRSAQAAGRARSFPLPSVFPSCIRRGHRFRDKAGHDEDKIRLFVLTEDPQDSVLICLDNEVKKFRKVNDQ